MEPLRPLRLTVQRVPSAGASHEGVPALVRRALGAATLVLVFAPGLAAQEPSSCAAPLELHGSVRSAEDGSPVVGASVVFPSRQLRLLSDEDGRFVARGVCPGTVEVSVSHLAFGTTTHRVALVGDQPPLELHLRRRAIPVEGVVVEVEPVIRLLERRRMAVARKSGVYHASDFAPHQIPSSIAQHVAARTGHPLEPCTGSALDRSACYPYRGRRSEVRTVCVDSAPIDGGLDVLELWPQDDIARLEFYPGLAMIKVFTKGFVSRAAGKPWLLQGRLDHC